MNKIIKAALLGAMLATINTSYALINVTPVIVDIQSDSAGGDLDTQDVNVFNNDKEVAYVQVTPKIVQNPGTPSEKQVVMANPEDLGLLVSPRKLVIPPDQFKIVRFVFTQKPAAVDRIFRVDIQPVTAGLLIPGSKQKQDVGIKLLVGYAVLVIQRPVNAKPIISITRDGRTVTLKNTGNTNALLESGQQCDSKGKNCQKLPVDRLYAGNTWSFTAPASSPVTFIASYGDSTINLKSN